MKVLLGVLFWASKQRDTVKVGETLILGLNECSLMRKHIKKGQSQRASTNDSQNCLAVDPWSKTLTN